MPALLPYYAALLAGILFGVMGQILLKIGAERTAGVAAQFLDAFTILGFATYAIAAIFYIVAIKNIPLSLAFPSVSASYVIVAVIGHARPRAARRPRARPRHRRAADRSAD